jgi:hypothetical protein
MNLRVSLLSLAIVACASRTGPETRSTTPRPLLALSSAETGVAAASIRAVIDLLPSDTAAACVTLSGGPPAYWYSPDTSLMRRIGAGARRVVAPAECPPTYSTMIARIDSSGRPNSPVAPPGYVDPHEITVGERRMIGADFADVTIDVSQGTLNDFYRCTAHRPAGGEWAAQCRKTGSSIS